MRHCSFRSSVLDLGAGSGALLARLRDVGFNDLSAIDSDPKQFGLQGVEPHPIDLNSDFAQAVGQRVKVVTAIEIIEHIDSPRHFLRQTYEIIEPEGYLLLSTPNVANWRGRLEFLLTGRLRYFDREQYLQMHHVSPLTDVQVRLMLEEIGFDLVDSTTAGDFSGLLQRVALAPLSLAFRLVFGPRAWGDVTIYLLRKPIRPVAATRLPSSNPGRP